MALSGKNITLPIYHRVNGVQTSFHDLVLHKFTVDSVVMSLGDKITGDIYYNSPNLVCSMKEYVVFNDIEYTIVNPPTLVKEGMVSDNSDLKGMSKYSFEFYHPMYILGNLPFTDVAVSYDELRYKSQDKTFAWIGKPADFVAKLNKNLENTEWVVVMSDRFPQEKEDQLSEVLTFDKNTIAEVLKTGYETWEVPFVVDKLNQGEYYHTDANNNNVDYYTQGKRFVVVFGLPSNEIYAGTSFIHSSDDIFIFQFGQGVGLKNHSRTPRNNKIVTRISGCGSERNIPYGYPQIRWYGNSSATCTIGDSVGAIENYTAPNGNTYDLAMSYPIYEGIVGGQWVKLIKHPFTRKNLMPSIYVERVFNKVSQYIVDESTGNVIANPNYDPDIEILDYYDAVGNDSNHPYVNIVNTSAPSYENHEFEDIYPELGEARVLGVETINDNLTPASGWDDSMDDDGNYLQGYFKITLPQLSFDLYACAAITEEMQINMRSGACIGCTFTVQVDWDDYKKNFYNSNGDFDPAPHTSALDNHVRDLTKYPNSANGSITVVVQKDINTFGTLMPNIYQHPKGETSDGADDGDLFVILGISLPLEYIVDAQERLDEAMKSYMLENNVYYFDYPLKFDEYFLANNTNILNQIRPNSIVHFLFNNEELQLFVKQLTIKYNENTLPQYDITLTDNIEVVLNQIGQVADDVEHLSTLISLLRQQYGKNVYVELANKLSRVDDDSARGVITFLRGLNAGQYQSGGFLGSGAHIGSDGKAEFEEITVRGAMRAAELVFNLISAEEGESIRSIGHGEILTVSPLGVAGGATLKLEGDEWATISPGDICRGIYNTIDKDFDNSNIEEGFDNNGFRTTKGFFSSYFQILSVNSSKGSCSFSYVLQMENGQLVTEHPCPLMKFAVYGNVNNSKKERQSSIYTTAVGVAPRKLFLSGVNTWKINPQNIKIAIGNIEGLKVVEELVDSTEYASSEDPDKFTIVDDNEIIHYYQHKTLNGDAGFYCEDNIYLGGIINQFKAAALETITTQLSNIGSAWISVSYDTFVVDCDSNGNIVTTKDLILDSWLYYGNNKCSLNTGISGGPICYYLYNGTKVQPSFSESNTQASKTYTFTQGNSLVSGTITVFLKGSYNGTTYSATKTVSIIASKQGSKGDAGAYVRFLGDWNADLRPVWNNNFRDCVKYSGTYWLVNVPSDGIVSLGEPSISNTNWENIGEMRFVATELLLAEQATIKNLIASKLITGQSPQPHIEISGSQMNFFGTLPFPNIRLGVIDNINDDNFGCAVLEFYDKNGTYLYNLGPEGLVKMDSVSNGFRNVLMKDITTVATNKTTSGIGSIFMNIKVSDCTTYYEFVEGYVKNQNGVKIYKISGSDTPSQYNGKTYDDNTITSGISPHPSGNAISGWFLLPNYGEYLIMDVGTIEYKSVFAFKYESGRVSACVQVLFEDEHDWWRDTSGSERGGLSSGTSLLDFLEEQAGGTV